MVDKSSYAHPRYILGISAQYHDSAVCLVKNGEIAFAAQEERFTRKKHDPAFPTKAIISALEYENITLSDLAAVVYYEKPLLKFERLLESYLITAPWGWSSFVAAVIVWIKEKFLARRFLSQSLKVIGLYDAKKTPLLFSEHHLSHSASAFYPSPFQNAAIVTLDGVGEWASVTIAHGKGTDITLLKELRFPHSPGLLYSAVTYYCGFRVNSGEYKLMGLAPYGNTESQQVAGFVELIKKYIVNLNLDGSFTLDQTYFSYATGLAMTNDKKWEEIFGVPRQATEAEPTQVYCDLALAFQQVTEEIILAIVKNAKLLTGEDNLCLAGGVALNCVANSKIVEAKIFDNVWIQPAAGDAGGALGAAMAVEHMYFSGPRLLRQPDAMKGSYLGPEFSEVAIEHGLQNVGAKYTKLSEEDLYKKVADILATGNVVGWFQGRMEWGPRALGNRSIIADARSEEMQKRLNLSIKFREGFRPFAPIVLAERAADYFEGITNSPYMLFVSPVSKAIRNLIPVELQNKDWREKLYFKRSTIPAITHLDYSARLQSVHKETNYKLHSLLSAFESLTGTAVLVNTSFNVRGQPIVCTPMEAFQCFMSTDMDYLVLGSCLLAKTAQPEDLKIELISKGVD